LGTVKSGILLSITPDFFSKISNIQTDKLLEIWKVISDSVKNFYIKNNVLPHNMREKTLYNWISRNRYLHTLNKLDKYKIRVLLSITPDFFDDKKTSQFRLWNETSDRLKSFYKENPDPSYGRVFL
jgi:hypothetical protein